MSRFRRGRKGRGKRRSRSLNRGWKLSRGGIRL